MSKPRFNTEQLYAAVSIFAGAFIAILLAPKNSFFFANFAYFWIPQAVVLGILVPFSFRPAILAGAAIVLAVYLAIFGAWSPSPITWVGYLLSLPGSLIGAIVGALILNSRESQIASKAFLFIALCTFIGLAVNQTLICSTIVYCGWK